LANSVINKVKFAALQAVVFLSSSSKTAVMAKEPSWTITGGQFLEYLTEHHYSKMALHLYVVYYTPL
jgi:hypothetical protein